MQRAQRVRLHDDISVLSNDDEVTVFGYYGSCTGSAGCVGGSDTDTLEFAQTNYVADECDNIYGQHVSGPHDLCIKDDLWADGLQSVCMGDSGSPALVDDRQIGLNSWGPGDCNPIYPTVLTSVPHYFAWISETCPQCVGKWRKRVARLVVLHMHIQARMATARARASRPKQPEFRGAAGQRGQHVQVPDRLAQG